MDACLSALGRAQHVVGVADVTPDQLDSDIGQRGGFVRIADQGPNPIAPLDQLLADVAASLPGRAGDEDRAGHGRPPGVTYRTYSVTTVNLDMRLFYIQIH